MSKAKLNKFLAGYFGVLVLGGAALGYFAWSSYNKSVEARQLYEGSRSKLTSLRSAKIFPNQENVDAKRKQVDAYVNTVNELVNRIYTYQTAPSTISNTQFQIKLADYRDAIVTEAANANVELPKDFTLGMTQYLGETPRQEAVPDLDAWLDGLNFFVRTLILNGVTSLDKLERIPQAFESGAAEQPAAAPRGRAAAAATTSRQQTRGGAASASNKKEEGLPESAVIRRYPFTVQFTGSSRVVNAVLTQLANTSPDQGAPFFFTIRALRLENEKKEPPSSNLEVKVQETSIGDRKVEHDAVFIYGNEKITAFLDVDLVRFLDPAAN